MGESEQNNWSLTFTRNRGTGAFSLDLGFSKFQATPFPDCFNLLASVLSPTHQRCRKEPKLAEGWTWFCWQAPVRCSWQGPGSSVGFTGSWSAVGRDWDSKTQQKLPVKAPSPACALQENLSFLELRLALHAVPSKGRF